MPLSEGLEEYSVWIETDENPVRDSSVDKVYLFKKGEVKAYKLEDITIEDFHDPSDDELVDNINSTSISESVKESIQYITLDDLENTESIRLEMPDVYYQLSSPDVIDNDASSFIGTFHDYYTYTTDPNYNHKSENYSKFLKTLEKYRSFKAEDGHDLSNSPHPQTYVPDPIVWETTDQEILFSSSLINQLFLERPIRDKNR